MNRLLTDLQTIGLAVVVGWAGWRLVPIMWAALCDPWRDRFEDVDELAERDR